MVELLQHEELLNWMFGILAVNIITMIGAVIAVVKSIRMMPREEAMADIVNKGVELNNKVKEVDAFVRYEDLIDKANERNTIVRLKLDTLFDENRTMKSKTADQEHEIGRLQKTMTEHSEKLNGQNTLLEAQQKEIVILREALAEARKYIDDLLKQFKDMNIKPVKEEK